MSQHEEAIKALSESRPDCFVVFLPKDREEMFLVNLSKDQSDAIADVCRSFINDGSGLKVSLVGVYPTINQFFRCKGNESYGTHHSGGLVLSPRDTVGVQ